MPVVLVSADFFEIGQRIAVAVTEHAGFRLVGREILARVASARGFDEGKLVRALDGSTGLLGMADDLRTLCLAFIQEAVVEELITDGVVCHGLAAHLFVYGVSHALKVRILSDPEAKARELAAEKGVSVERARTAVGRAMTARRCWSKAAFGTDETDPSIYDLVIKVSQIEPERAVGIIVDTARDGAFSSMTYSRKRLDDLLLESRARSALVERFPHARVQARDGRLVVQVAALKRLRQRRVATVESLVGKIPGLEGLEVQVAEDYLGKAAESLR